MLAQELVHGKGIGLVAIVGPSGAGADDNGPSVGDGGQLVVDGRIVEFLIPPLFQFPEGCGRCLAAGAGCAQVENGLEDWDVGAVFFLVHIFLLPQHVGGVQDFRSRFGVEEQAAGGSADIYCPSLCQGAEGSGQSVGIPLSVGSAFGADHGAHIVGKSGPIGIFRVNHLFAIDHAVVGAGSPAGSPQGYDGERIVDLGFAIEGQTREAPLVGLRKSIALGGVGRDALERYEV